MKFKLVSFISIMICMLVNTILILVKIDNITPQVKATNKIIELNYDYKMNLYNPIFIRDNDTFALDFVHPSELDSLIQALNK